MSESTPPPLAPAFKDRRVGLVVFGIILALIGGILALSALLSPLGQFAEAQRNGHPVAWNSVVLSLIYGLLIAGAVLWVAVGSMLCLRWVRPVVLCASIVVAAMGLLEMAVLPSILGRALRHALDQRGQAAAASGVDEPDHAFNPHVQAVVMEGAKWTALGFVAVFLIGLPLLYFWYYSRRDVLRTVEARDPRPRWTDGIPIPLVGGCLLAALSGVLLLVAPKLGGAFLFFGLVISGLPGYGAWLAFALVSLYAARGFYRRDRMAWSAYFALTSVMGASTLVTWCRLGSRGIYAHAGLPAWQVDQVTMLMAGTDKAVALVTGAYFVLLLGFLLYLRRYFPPPGSGSAKAM